MPYRFKFDEKIQKGFRRIAGEQVALATDELSIANLPATAIHSSRKAIKRLRALVRCAGPALGPKAARQHDKALRDIGRLLSNRRDADVLLDTLTKMEEQVGAEAVAMLRPLRIEIEARQAASSSATLATDDLPSIRDALVAEGEALAEARLKGSGISKIIDGVEQTYRDGQAAMRRAYKSPTDESMHDLRKSVQAHWRHMALLSRAWPEEFAVRIAAARELSQILGDDHDLALLKSEAWTLEAADAQVVVDLCEQQQNGLRWSAYSQAVRLYAEDCGDFARRISAYWTAMQRVKLAEKKAAAAIMDEAVSTAAGVAPDLGSQSTLAAKTPL